jgi:hypothetical protein
MRLFKLLSISILVTLFTISCTKNNYQKGKKGDFLFRKCTSCEKVEF